jgi:hypothetical protein
MNTPRTPPVDRRSRFQRWFPGLHKAYLALSPKYRRRREAAVVLWGRRFVAKQRLGGWMCDAYDQALFDALSGNR